MNILMVYGDPRKIAFGGVEEHTNNLIHYLSRKDVYINVLTYGDDNAVSHLEGVNYHVFNRLVNNLFLYLFFLPYDLFRLINCIRKLDFDIIHFQGFHPLFCLAAIWCQRKYPTVITMHGISSVEMNYHKNRNYFFKVFSKIIEKYTYSKIKNKIIVAPQIEKLINKPQQCSKTYIIPNGVDINLINSIKTSKSNKGNRIIFIGNLIQRKGVCDLIRVIYEVKKDISDVCLLMVGSGEEERNLMILVKELGLETNVKFFGFVKGNKKYTLIKSADIFVLPSYWESLPIVVLEGMACGKPIIASNVGGVPYLVNDGVNGFLVPPGNINKLSDKIITLLKDKELQEKMGNESLKHSKGFDWNKIAKKTYDVYYEIINNRN